MIQAFIFASPTDLGFLKNSLPPLLKMCHEGGARIALIADYKKPSGILAKNAVWHPVEKFINFLEKVRKTTHFEILLSDENEHQVESLTNKHFGKPLKETKCFRGYPTFQSIKQFHRTTAPYILHLDCDMLFYEAPDYSWINDGVKVMEENDDILCVLPRGGPPSANGSLHQGSTLFQVDKKRNLFLFKNFTSRHYLIHRERFLSLLPMKPLWLSWREPLKSRLFNNGKMLCWEAIVEKALKKSHFWRADLMTEQAWSLHPGERTEEFYNILPTILNHVINNRYPEEQGGHFDLRLKDWKNYIG